MRRRSPGGMVRRVSGVSVRGRILALLMSCVTASVALVAFQAPAPAEALDPSEFNPGYIISDELFYDNDAMSAAEIQSFLDARIGQCLTTRCLNVAVLPVISRPASYSSNTGALVCSAIAGGNLAASELIYRAQVACGISAKVILVTLQKEQALVTNRAPSDWALRAAMGMGCPDTAPCDDAFSGLANQIISGTRQLQVYKMGQFGRQPGLHFIQYHPNSACGGTNVNVQNYATAALYNYTPYQPNPASLANIGSTGDSCSSYGNRNFWVYYNNWFGPTTEIPCTVNPSRDITRYWTAQGAAAGPFGASISPGIAAGPAGTTIGYFANGDVYCTPRVGALGVIGDIRAKFESLGGPASSLGSPTSTRVNFTAGGISGFLQEFQRGTMLSSTTTGTYAVPHGSIRDAWGSRGGSGGALGWPVSDHEMVAGGMRQRFQYGLLMVPTGQAAILLSGEIDNYWLTGSASTALGSPTTAAMPFTAGGVSGTIQHFERGMVLASATTGTYAVLNGAVRNAWGAQGGSGGGLGWPIGDQESVSDGFQQEFQRGTVFASASGVGGTLTGDIATYWSAGTNSARLGYPTASPSAWSAGGVSGTLQYFERGMVLSSTSTGTYAVLTGPMRDAWGARGGSGGSLGWPTGDQRTVGGEVRQQFQRGLLTLGGTPGSAISTYLASGSNATRLGSASGPATAWSAGGVSGMLQYFQRGMVLSSSTTGTFSVMNGAVRDAWGAQGGSGGTLGWPTAEQETVGSEVRQQFQNGVLTIGNGVSGDIATYLATGSNASRLGSASGPASAWSAGGVSGMLQYFQRGMVLSSGTTGTFSVLTGPMRDAWGARGGSGGSLGWPTGDQESVPGGVRQQFQNGMITVSTGGTGAVLAGDIAAYWNTGSNATRLGSPTSSASAWTAGGVTGILQYFQRGLVMSSSTTGTFAVLDGPVRNTWSARGGSGGILGWPIGDQEAHAGGVRQQFHLGTLSISAEGAPITLTGQYYQYWSAGSNATLLGTPTATALTWSAGGVSGSYQVFQRGMVMSSTSTGTFAVLDGPIRNMWGGAGGSGGSLGWPTGDQQTVAEGVQQQFQRGMIMVPTTGAPYIIPG